MSVRNILLGSAAAAVMSALFTLFIQVRAGSVADVSDEALAEARRRYERNQSAAAPAPVVRPPVPRELDSRPTPPAPPPEVGRVMAEFEKTPEPPEFSAGEPPRLGLRRAEAAPPSAGVELKQRMDEVNAAYDRRDYEAAIAMAREILAEAPDNVRMLRVVVSSGCMMGDPGVALEFLSRLPERDQRQMRTRCSRYGMELPPGPSPDR